MKELDAESFLQIDPISYLKLEKVEVEEFGGFFYVRELTGEELDRFLAVQGDLEVGNVTKEVMLRASKMLTVCIVNKDGKQIFKTQHHTAIYRHGFQVIKKLMDKVNEINGLTEKQAEEMEKNSAPTQSGDSNTV